MGRKTRRSKRRRETLDALTTFARDTANRRTRLQVLQRYAEVRVKFADGRGYSHAKSDAKKSRRGWWRRHTGAHCFVGCGRLAVHAHHIIQIQHGGADIPENKVPLCEPCHATVHPWMTTETDIPPDDRPFWG